MQMGAVAVPTTSTSAMRATSRVTFAFFFPRGGADAPPFPFPVLLGGAVLKNDAIVRGAVVDARRAFSSIGVTSSVITRAPPSRLSLIAAFGSGRDGITTVYASPGRLWAGGCTRQQTGSFAASLMSIPEPCSQFAGITILTVRSGSILGVGFASSWAAARSSSTSCGGNRTPTIFRAAAPSPRVARTTRSVRKSFRSAPFQRSTRVCIAPHSYETQ